MTQAISLPMWGFVMLLAVALLAAADELAREKGASRVAVTGRVHADPGELSALRYDANSIAHPWVPAGAGAAVAQAA